MGRYSANGQKVYFLLTPDTENSNYTAGLAAASHRPGEEFARGFAGMTQEPVTLADLEAAWEAIIAATVAAMPEDHRRFLVGFKRGEPDWEILGIPGTQHLPAIMWKQRNLAKLPDIKRRELADVLERVLFP